MDKSNNLVKNTKGFTLTEMLIVVSIIAFLLTLIIVYFRTQAFKGSDAKKKGEIHRIQVAIEEYEKDHDCYPPKILIDKGCNPNDWLKPYLDKIPCDDPKAKTPYVIEIDESSCPSWYTIYTNLENTKDIDIEELGCIYGCGPEYAYNYYVSNSGAPAVSRSFYSGAVYSTDAEGYKLWGCLNGLCQRISRNPRTGVAECQPNYTTPDCNNRCSDPSKECLLFKN